MNEIRPKAATPTGHHVRRVIASVLMGARVSTIRVKLGYCFGGCLASNTPWVQVLHESA